MNARNGRKEKMTTKDTFIIFALWSIITLFVGGFIAIFEMFLWDMTDSISIEWSWKHPERSTIIHAIIMATINAVVFCGGFLAVWLAKG